ncbi:MAG TPA: peptidase P60 [Firmicutes bacterium]|nr:peptidase P60 [Bacillota bacterium]
MRPATPGSCLLALICLLLVACSSTPGGKSPTAGEQYAVRMALYDQFGTWRGVPYRLGGMSRSGVDCSGLVQLTYRDLFGIRLPRTTSELAGAGYTVKPRERRSGDLVFFRVSRSLNHVGIYLDNNRFMHASASSGVMISSLDDAYWKKRYWKTVRPRSSLLAQR